MIAAETAVSEAVLKYNAGTLRAYTELCTTIGVKPGQHALQRAEEKDSIRKKKAKTALQTRGQMAKRRHIQKDTKSHSPGVF